MHLKLGIICVIGLVSIMAPAVISELGDYIYFPSHELRTWTEAKDYCVGDGGEIAKVTDYYVYMFLREKLPRFETHWVDGEIPAGTKNISISNIQLDSSCTSGKLEVDSRVPQSLPQSVSEPYCLALVKGKDIRSSKMEALPCTTKYFVACAYPHVGCTQNSTKGT